MDAKGNSAGEIDKGNACTDPVDKAGFGRSTYKLHEHLGPDLVAELERQAGQRKTEEADDHQEVEENVPSLEATVNGMSIGYDMSDVTFHEGLCLFPVLHKAAEHPEQRVEPEYGKGAHQQAGHGNEGVKEDGIFLPVGVLAMGIELGKERCSIFMALGAGYYQVLRVDA